jgi:hypothetical protein
LQLGKSNFLELEEEQIEQALSGEAMLAKDVRDMFPRKPGSTGLRGRQTLIFYRQYWKVVVTHKQAKNHVGLVIDVENGKALERAKADTAHTILLFEDMPKTLKKKGRSWEKSETHTVGFLVAEKGLKWDRTTFDGIIKELHEDYKDEDIQAVRKSMRKFTGAGYKSILQKIIRYAPIKVEGEGKTYPSEFFLAVVVADLLLHPGAFVPDIQRFVSGLESLVKRLVVIYFEDSYVDEETKGSILSLSASAFLAQRVKSWRPRYLEGQTLVGRGKEGRREGGKEGRREGGKEGRREGRKDGGGKDTRSLVQPPNPLLLAANWSFRTSTWQPRP